MKCKAMLVSTFLISLTVPGKVSILEEAALDSFHSQMAESVIREPEEPKLHLKAGDIYKELRLRGYDYGKTFQGILESNNAGKCVQTDFLYSIKPSLCFDCMVAFL